MARVSVLLELPAPADDAAFEMHREASESAAESERQAEWLLRDLAGYGVEPYPDYAPVPLFSEQVVDDPDRGFENFAREHDVPDLPAETLVVAVTVDEDRLDELRARPGVTVWDNSPMILLDGQPRRDTGIAFFGGVECAPFSPPATVEVIRNQLGVRPVWERGFRGQGVVVGVVDNGISGGPVYPVVGGFPRPGLPFPAGGAHVTSHGSMCAAGVRLAAPEAALHDYRFPSDPEPGHVARLFQAVLSDRRQTGRPQITSNSYGRLRGPAGTTDPSDPAVNPNHPMHRKIREVVKAGVTTFFAAGNCGLQCPFPTCDGSSIGPGRSIHGPNSLGEVITVAAVNHRRERLGYSAQGPGAFHAQKPDLSSFTHYFGNFGPGRPGGTAVRPFDDGTSAATPVAAGVAALLLSAFPNLTPAEVKRVLLSSADNLGAPGWNADTGFGVLNAAAAFAMLS